MNKYDIPEERLQLFFNTAWERHRIYTLKTIGVPKPWTENYVFRNYYFCNVFRRIDKTTDYLVKNVIEPNEDNPELWKAIMLFRYISRLDTYKELQGHEFCFLWIYRWMRSMQERKIPIFTNAFIVNSKGIDGGWVDKVTYIFKLIQYFNREYTALSFDDTLKSMDRLEEAFTALKEAPGVGPFMAYQYCMDFAYSKRYLYSARDKFIWTYLGIGAQRGMNRLLHGEPKKTKILFDINIASWIYERWTDEIFKHLEDEIDFTYMQVKKVFSSVTRKDIENYYQPFRELHMGDVEHWLCEYDKFCRGGSKKRRYAGV